MKDMPAEIRTDAEDICHLAVMVDQLPKSMEAKTRAQESTMEEIKVALQQLLLSSAHNHGSTANSGSTMRVSPITTISPSRDIFLGFPHFDGTSSVLQWIVKADKFFNYHNTQDVDHVEIASMHFEKDVVPWFQMLQKIDVVTTWETLTRALKSHFGPSPFDCSMSELFKLHQQGSVSEYYLKFMSLAKRSEGLGEAAILNCFISGLKVDIKRDVMALSLLTLLRAVALAKLYEDKYQPNKSSPVTHTSRDTYPSFVTSFSVAAVNKAPPSTSPTTKSMLPSLLPNPSGPPFKTPNVKCISPTEMQLKREKGLCYFCDEKFSFNHKCPNLQLYFLQLVEEKLVTPW